MFKTRDDFKKLVERGETLPEIKLIYKGSLAHFTNGITRFFLEQVPLLEKLYNVHLPRPEWVGYEAYDLIWASIDQLTQEDLDSGLPIIVEDAFQGPDLSKKTRQALKHKNVKFLLKSMMTHDETPHNREMHNYSIHQDVIAKYAPKDLAQKFGKIDPEITSEDYQKVRLSWNWITWPHFRHGFTHDSQSLRDYFLNQAVPRFPQYYTLPHTGKYMTVERQYDIHFVGNTKKWPDDVPFLKHHRQQVLDALAKCDGNNCISSDRIGWHDYWTDMRQSKIVVSPWGWEPVTIRDVEAVLAGSVLIKPDTSFVKTYPHIPCIRCKPDFSDLPQVVKSILAKWDGLYEYRQKAYDDLIKQSDTMLERVYKVISDAYLQEGSS